MRWVGLCGGKGLDNGTDFDFVAEQKFQKAWHQSAGPVPPIKKIYKIIENDGFLKPYAAYK
jgi:hypothetical protein